MWPIMVNNLRHLGGMLAAPAFRIEVVRNFAMKRCAALTFQPDYPALEAKHLDNPKLFANREDLIQSMQFAKGGVIAEIGVAGGDFSEYLLNILEPRRFVAFDIFTLHETPFPKWRKYREGWDPRVYLDNMTHLDYYKRRFADRGDQIIFEVGEADVCLRKYPDNTFDLIYIDANHSYAAVKKDAAVAKIKLAGSGVMIFNDYTMFDPLVGEHYGVVQTVNELVVNDNWRVCGFALEKCMFCDIAVRKWSGSRAGQQTRSLPSLPGGNIWDAP